MTSTLLIIALLAAAPSPADARGLVSKALKCIPGPRLACATHDDALGEVETTYLKSEVINVRTVGAGIEAWVKRTSLDRRSVLFHYELDRDGTVRKRSCHAPEVTNGMLLSNGPIPYQVIEDRLVFKNPCDMRLSCFEGAAAAKSFAIQAGRLVDEKVFNPAGMSGDSFPAIPLGASQRPLWL